DADTIEVDLRQVEARIGHRIDAGGDAVVHELVHAPGFLRRQVILEREVLHRAAETAGEFAHVEACDRRNAADAIDDVVPGGGNRAAHRRDDAQTRNDYATLAQCSSDRIKGKACLPDRAGGPRGRTAPRGGDIRERSGLGAPIVDVVDRLLDGGDLLGFFIRNLDLELFYEGHHQLNGIQRVSAEIIDE